MNKLFKSRMIQSMVPYFILILGAILIFRLTAEFSFFAETVGRFWSVISPFLTGAVFAYVLNLPCSAIQRQLEKLVLLDTAKNNPTLKSIAAFIGKRSRVFSVLLLVLIVIFLITIVLNIFIPAVVSSIDMFMEDLPRYEDTIRNWIITLEDMDLPEFLAEQINEDAIISSILGWAGNVDITGIMNGIIAGFGGFASTMFHTFLSIVASIYILLGKDSLKAFATKLVAAITSESTNKTILKYAHQLDFNFRQYIFAQTIDGMILGSIMTVVLLFFVPQYAIVLGLILGVINYIPYFGSIFGTAFAVLVVAFTQGIPVALLAAIIMFAIQQLDGNYIQPKLMGKTFAMPPLLIIISVTIGMNYGGVLGMLVAIPIVAILKDLLDIYIRHREEVKNNPPPVVEGHFMDREFWQ